MRSSNRRAKVSAIKTYIIEEQEVYREAYRHAFVLKPMIELRGVSGREGINSLSRLVFGSNPDVLLIGVKKLTVEIIQEIIRARTENPGMGVVLMAMNYNIKEIELLHSSFTTRNGGGIAFFSKQSLDGIEQLCNIISRVYHGEVILDRLVTAVYARKSKCEFLKDLTARELEILSLLAMGYSNLAIAESLCIDVKTVKHHINNMYGKLDLASDLKGRHLRVSAARMYLEGNGFNNQTVSLFSGD
jgi:DNA-binding NarL/FixJ family response regulator